MRPSVSQGSSSLPEPAPFRAAFTEDILRFATASRACCRWICIYPAAHRTRSRSSTVSCDCWAIATELISRRVPRGSFPPTSKERAARRLIKRIPSSLLPPCFRQKTKGLADVSQPPVLIGGANRDRTGDLYNAIEPETQDNQWLSLAERRKRTHQSARA